MTVAELIDALLEMDGTTRLVCIQHPDITRGYYPAGDFIAYTTVTRQTGETHQIAALSLQSWSKAEGSN